MYFICFNHHKPKAVATATCSRLAQGAQGAVKTRARDRPGGEKSSRVSGLISYEMFIFINIHTYIHTYIHIYIHTYIYIYGIYGRYIYIYIYLDYMVCIYIYMVCI